MRTRSPGRYLLPLFALLLALVAPVAALRFIAFLIFFVTGGAFAYGLLVPRMIRSRRLDPEIRGSRQEPLRERIWIENSLPFPLPRIVVAESTGRLHCDRPVNELILPASGGTELAMTMRSERRGEYHYGPLELRGRDPFGLYPWSRLETAGGRAVVYPRLYSLLLENRRGSVGGSIPTGNPAFEDVTRFRSLREYASGDDPKRVNWKASAKAGKLFTTVYERTLSVSVRILLDLMSDDYPPRRREQLIERAVEVAAALVVSYARIDQRIGLVVAGGLPGVDEPPRGREAAQAQASPFLVFRELAGRSHSERLLEALSRAEPRNGRVGYSEMVYAAGRSLPSDLRMIVIAPMPNERQLDELRLIASRHLQMELFEVPTEGSDPELIRGVVPSRRITEAGEELLEQ